MSFKSAAITTARTTVVAIVTALVVIVFVAVAFHGQTAQQQQVADTLVRTNQAVACELALPVTSEGRDPELVKLCFTQYGLVPPITQNA